MRTDTLFYQLFNTFRSLLFELIDQPPSDAEGYEFVSVEVKEKAFRFDGIFLAAGTEKPVIFAEVQFQPKDDFYWAFISEIYLYLNQYQPKQDWQAVAIFARRSYDPGEQHHFRELFASNRITRVYLEDWRDRTTNSLGIAIVQLILAPEAKAPELARQLATQVEQETTPDLRGEIVEFIETVLVYKFPKLGREEIQAMFTLDDLRQTRVYQEAQEEALQKAILRQLSRKLGQISLELKSKIEALATPQLENLTEALLDFTSVANLEDWLRDRA
jgi:predicted transposase/invertase (TIGR01784 family)